MPAGTFQLVTIMKSGIMMITISSLKEGDDNHKDDIHDKMFRNLVPLPEYSLVKKVGRMAGYQLRSFH